LGKSGIQSGTDDEYQTSALISGSEAYATGNEDLKEIDEISDYDEELEKNAIILDKFAENFNIVPNEDLKEVDKFAENFNRLRNDDLKEKDEISDYEI
jgi:hypothetical protein